VKDALQAEFSCRHDRSQALSDAMLLADICSGCRNCFSQLFRRYYSAVFASAFNILRDRSEAEDVAQEVFLSILQKREQYDPCRGQIKSWILHFAHFKALTRRRNLRLRQMFVFNEIEDIEEIHRRPKWQAYRMSSVEWTQFVEKGLVTLTAHQRHAIELIHFEGYTLLEASGIMEEGLSNIKNHYFRGMKILREFFNAADRTTSASRKMEENSISAEPSLRLRLQSSSGRCV